MEGVLADQCLYWRIVIFSHSGTLHNHISAGTVQKEYCITTGPSVNVRQTFLPIPLLCSGGVGGGKMQTLLQKKVLALPKYGVQNYYFF